MKLLGAGDRVRTGDIQLGRLTLYQLSYSRIMPANIKSILFYTIKTKAFLENDNPKF